MTRLRGNIVTVLALMGLIYPGYALSQTSSLPWQSQNSGQPSSTDSSSSSTSSSHHHGKHHNAAQAPAADAAPTNLRKEDDRKLNELATEYYGVSAKSKNPVETLVHLQKRTEAYRTMLSERGYNAGDLIHDTDSLIHRIAAKKKKITAEEAAKAPAAASVPALPTPLPATPAPAAR